MHTVIARNKRDINATELQKTVVKQKVAWLSGHMVHNESFNDDSKDCNERLFTSQEKRP